MSEKVPLFIVAVAAVVLKDGRFLAGKRSENEVAFPGKWTIPGGKVEHGQRILDALRQEVKEETDIDIKNIFFAGDFGFIRPDGHNVVGLNFICEYGGGQERTGEDMTQVRWLTIEEAEKLDFTPGIMTDIKKAFAIYRKQL